MKKILFVSLLLVYIFNCAFAAAGYPFTFKESGSGAQSVILIPGFACSGEVWNETVAQLQTNHKCYVLNMAGFAGVPADAAPDISDWVREIARYIQTNHIERPVIIGHSLGGVIAQWLAADYPQLVSKIVVVDALPCLPAISNAAFAASTKPDCSLFINSFTGMPEEQFYQMQRVAMASMVSDTSKVTTAVQWSVKSDRNTMALIYCQLLNTDLRIKISNVKCPALIMLEPSFKALQSSVEEQYRNLKGAQLNFADKGLHFIMYDDKDWYFAQLKNFIQ